MNLPPTDILIIGAGISGLSAGCYAQMNGYKTKIMEMHHLPGGLCTAWERKGYVFDGCLHYLLGSGKGQPYHRVWEELGAIQGRQFVHHDEMMRITAPDGKTLIIYADPDRLEAHMKEISPGDSHLIESFCSGIRKFKNFDMSLLQQKPRDLMSLVDWAKLAARMMPYGPSVLKWGLLSAREFGDKFQVPFLRRAVPQMFAWEDIPVMVGMALLASLNNRNAGFPVGASLAFARSIETRYLDLGGEVHYRSQVQCILTENGKAVGVRLYDNTEHYAKRVIAACDGRRVIFDMLDGKYTNRQIRRMYDGHMPIHSQLQVSLGVNRDLSAYPHWVTHLLEEPVLIAGEKRYEINVKHYCYDPTLAPPGKSILIAMLTTKYNYWEHLYGRPIYDGEQVQESGILIDWLETVYPGLKDDVEFIDVATPLSYERYTGNWQGSSSGWLLTKDTMLLNITGMRKTLPGLNNLYLTGQWVEPGGMVPVVAMSGRSIIQHICHEDSVKFKATLPA